MTASKIDFGARNPFKLTYEENSPIDGIVMVDDFLLDFTNFTLNDDEAVLLAHCFTCTPQKHGRRYDPADIGEHYDYARYFEG